MNSGGNRNEVWQVVQPKDLLRLWQNSFHHMVPSFPRKKNSFRKAPVENSRESLLKGHPSDTCGGHRNETGVPKGFLAVYVGPKLRRFVIPTSYLSLPDFRVVMERVADEFGFEQEGGLRIPCEEEDFEEILLRCLAKNQKTKKNSKKKK